MRSSILGTFLSYLQVNSRLCGDSNRGCSIWEHLRMWTMGYTELTMDQWYGHAVGKNVRPQILSTSDEYVESGHRRTSHFIVQICIFCRFHQFHLHFWPQGHSLSVFFWGLPLGLQRILFFRALSPPKLLGRLEPMVPRCWCKVQ